MSPRVQSYLIGTWTAPRSGGRVSGAGLVRRASRHVHARHARCFAAAPPVLARTGGVSYALRSIVKRGRANVLKIWCVRVLALLGVLMLLQPLQDASLACFAFNLCDSGVARAPLSTAAHAGADEASGDDCCPEREGSHSDDERHGSCPCPSPCSVGCGGHPRGMVTSTALPVVVPHRALVLFARHAQRTPKNPEPLGIMHVPKHALT